MTIKEFYKIINVNTRVRVIDAFGFVGEYNVDDLLKEFNPYTRISEIKAYDFDIIFISIDGL